MFGTIIMDSYKSDEIELMPKILIFSVHLWIHTDGHQLASIHFGTTTLKKFYILDWLPIYALDSDSIMGYFLSQKTPVNSNKSNPIFPNMKGLGIQSWYNRLYPSRLSIETRSSIEIL